MHMIYDSDSFAVVQFDIAPGDDIPGDTPRRGGYEIVDKFGHKGIFLAGDLADTFRRGVQALMERNPSQEDVEEFVAAFATLAHQPVRLH